MAWWLHRWFFPQLLGHYTTQILGTCTIVPHEIYTYSFRQHHLSHFSTEGRKLSPPQQILASRSLQCHQQNHHEYDETNLVASHFWKIIWIYMEGYQVRWNFVGIWSDPHAQKLKKKVCWLDLTCLSLLINFIRLHEEYSLFIWVFSSMDWYKCSLKTIY